MHLCHSLLSFLRMVPYTFQRNYSNYGTWTLWSKFLSERLWFHKISYKVTWLKYYKKDDKQTYSSLTSSCMYLCNYCIFWLFYLTRCHTVNWFNQCLLHLLKWYLQQNVKCGLFRVIGAMLLRTHDAIIVFFIDIFKVAAQT